MKLQASLSIAIDLEEYAIPADGDIEEDVTEFLRDALFDLDGAELKTIKVWEK